VRDGLVARVDHLNLCRKNGYNRLLLLFPVLARQVGIRIPSPSKAGAG